MATIALPVAVFIGGAYLAYQGVVEAARADLAGDTSVMAEQALRVFDSQFLIARRINEIVGVRPDLEIATDEQALHQTLLNEFVGFPEVEAAWLLDAGGRRVLSSVSYPVDRKESYADRPYFQALRDTDAAFAIGRVRSRDGNSAPYEVLATRRGDPGEKFRGVVVVAVPPSYFENFDASLFNENKAFEGGLYGSDFKLLAGYPIPPKGAEPSSNEPLRAAAAAAAGEAGFFAARSPIDGIDQLVAFRKVREFGATVTASRTWKSIDAEWRAIMVTHLFFGVPATISLFLLCLLALRRSEREAAAVGRLEEEAERRELAEQALRQSQKMEAIGQLTGGIAHDFNNLLTAIGGSVELLVRRLPREDKSIERLSRAALDGVRRAASLTHRLLAFSRQQPLEIRPVSVNRLVSGMSELLRPTLGEKVALEVVLAGGLWPALTDANQLENAILNLAVNARDAMPQGGRLTIETANAFLDEAYAKIHAEVAPGQYVMVAVTDTGVGMPPEVAARAFDPFFTTKPAGVGTGLGLSMVYGFVKQSQGHVKIYSEPGAGTTIRIYLPRSMTETNAALPPQTVAGLHQADGEAVLVVEDDPAVRAFSAEALHECGYRVLEAGSAEEALAMIEREPDIALLFTDVGLPGGVNGRKLADAARALRPELPVLFTTGYTRNAIIHNGVLDPDVAFIAKPLSVEALQAKVRALLAAHRA